MKKKIIFVLLLICCSPAYLFAFTFDGWHSGMSLDEVLNIAEESDIAIRRDGLFGTKEGFHAGESRVYADKARIFYYKTMLVNEPARVSLFFTKESRLLYQVRIYWQGVNVKKALPADVEDMLRKKYGNPAKRRKLFSKDKVWHLDKENQLIMTNTGAALHLRYLNLTLEKKDSHEKKKNEHFKGDQDLNKF